MTYGLRIRSGARKDLTDRLPEAVAAVALEFIRGPLLLDPHRVGKPLRKDLEGLWAARRGQYRVIYQVLDDMIVVEVVRVSHRADAYH